MKKIVFILLLTFTIMSLTAKVYEKLDLNIATNEEIKELPITKEQAEDIIDYRNNIAFFKSIFDLRKIDSIDQKTLLLLKPMVIISHYSGKNKIDQRREDIYFLLQRLGGDDGVQEGMSDVWEDYLMTPRNINKLTFAEIMNIPSVSAVDAASIVRRVAQNDSVADYRDLRNTDGISYYGARNLRNYVLYKDQSANNKVYFDYQLKYNSIPLEDKYAEMGIVGANNNYPAVMNKLRIRYNNFKSGFMYYSPKFSKSLMDCNADDILQDGKLFIGYAGNPFKKNDFGIDNLESLKMKTFIGNYRATFGEGLVMENSDFYSSRKTGLGFSKRISGIIGDLSRTQEYSLRGLGLEINYSKFNGAFFTSIDKKDAVLYDTNNNGIFGDDDDEAFAFITSTLRPEDEKVVGKGEKLTTVRDAVEEKLIGFHLQYSPLIGTFVGITGYEARYDRDFIVPQTMQELQNLLSINSSSHNKYKPTDAEIIGLYSTKTSSYDRDYRRVIGLNWGTVLGHTSFQGEYAELEVNGSNFSLGDDPGALIVSTHTQFENLNFTILYRDYDIDFDNPYSRGFSESEKFDDTILEKDYYLTNPLLSEMFINSAQAQAERGIYFQTRYRFSRYFTITNAHLDLWERKMDSRQSVRFQSELEFAPIFQLALRAKYKHQRKRYDNEANRGSSTTNESTLKMIVKLSNYNRFQLGYRYTAVTMPPYVSLANNPDPGFNDTAVGNIKLHGDYIFADYTYHMNTNIKLVGSFVFWNGHGSSLWDYEDMEIDFMGEKGTKYWLTINDKISDNLYLTLKYKIKNYEVDEIEMRNNYNIVIDEFDSAGLVKETINSLRLQIDWKF